jgi:hypothetical protein
MMCRSDSASHVASSHSCTDAIVASQIQRVCSVAELSVLNAPRRGEAWARQPRSFRRAARSGRRATTSGPRGSRARRRCRRAACAMSSALPPWSGEAAREQGRRQGIEVGVRARGGSSELSRRAASRRSGGASLPCVATNVICACRRSARASSRSVRLARISPARADLARRRERPPGTSSAPRRERVLRA